MEKWTEVRRRVLTGELSKRAACQEYGINWRTLVKMLAYAEPPGYRRKAKREQPVVGPHLAWIHEGERSPQPALTALIASRVDTLQPIFKEAIHGSTGRPAEGRGMEATAAAVYDSGHDCIQVLRSRGRIDRGLPLLASTAWSAAA
ncbi:MAG: hypothetical protein ACKO6B_07325 [Planctomycetia bacterium]